jgi:hypothetical protein
MSPPILLHRVSKVRVTAEGHTHFAALCNGPFFAIEHAYSPNVIFPEFINETIPPQDVPVLVRHGCKVKPLSDKCPIAEKELVRGGLKGGTRSAITLLGSYWRGI